MARPPQSSAQIAAAAQARTQGAAQGRALGSPLIKRSQMLADLLEKSQNPQQIAGYGDLGVRLLSQALLQTAKGRTDSAQAAEASNADLARRQRIAAAVGGNIEGTPQEVGNGRIGNPLAGLVDGARNLFGGGQEPSPAPPPPVAPPVAPQPQPAPSAPMSTGPVEGTPMPPAANAPVPFSAPAPQATGTPTQAVGGGSVPAPPAPPQPAPNPLGPSAAERDLVLSMLTSGDPGLVAQAEQMAQDIRIRAAEPAALRYETQMVNGVPFRIDPTGASDSQAVFANGLPQQAQTQDVFNPEGTRAGTFGQRDPTGKLTLLEKPPEGYEARDGALRPIAGGPQDPSAGGAAITNERQLREEFQKNTAEYRAAQNGFHKVQAAAQDASGASDVALIFGFMKTLDPTSTVREGEFATAQNTGSIPERILSAYNRALNGDRLTDTQRNEFVNTAASQFQTYEQSYQNRLREYESMAQSYGLNSGNVVGTAGNQSRPSPSGGGNNDNVLRSRFTPEQARAELARRRGQ